MSRQSDNSNWVKRLAAISFDFGGTLFAYSGNSEEFKISERDFLIQLFQRYKISLEISGEELVQRFREIYWNRINDNFAKMRDDPDLVPRFREFFDSFGFKVIDGQIINKMAAEYGNFRFSPQTLTPYPQAVELLDLLMQKNLSTIIISNIPSRGAPHSIDFIENILEDRGMRGYFSELIYSGDIGALKPHPKIFQIAEERLKIAPSRILHVGDNWEEDIVGAKNRGWRTFWISHGQNSPENNSYADAIGKNLGEFYEWIGEKLD